MRCASGHENPDDSQFCSTCGLALPAAAVAELPEPTGPSTPLAPPMGYPPAQHTYGISHRPKNGFGVAALALGIISVFACGLSLIIGPLAIIFGALGIGRANRGDATNKLMAIWGLVLGAVGTLLYGVFIVVTIVANS